MSVPFGLHLIERTDLFFKSLCSAASFHQRGRVIAIFRRFENKMCQGPPVQIIEVEMAVHAWSAGARDDGPKWNNALVLQIRGEVRSSGDFVNPPYWIGIGIEPSESEFAAEEAAGGKIV